MNLQLRVPPGFTRPLIHAHADHHQHDAHERGDDRVSGKIRLAMQGNVRWKSDPSSNNPYAVASSTIEAQPPPEARTASRMRMAPAPYIAIISGSMAIIEAGREPSRYSPMSGLMKSRHATGSFEDFMGLTLIGD
jgi:hypothetical protein